VKKNALGGCLDSCLGGVAICLFRQQRDADEGEKRLISSSLHHPGHHLPSLASAIGCPLSMPMVSHEQNVL